MEARFPMEVTEKELWQMLYEVWELGLKFGATDCPHYGIESIEQRHHDVKKIIKKALPDPIKEKIPHE